MSKKKKSPPRKPNARAIENRHLFVDFIRKNPNMSSNQAKANFRKETGRSIGNEIAREVYRETKVIAKNASKVTRVKTERISEHSKKYLDRWSYLFKYKVIEVTEGQHGQKVGMSFWESAMYTSMEKLTVKVAYQKMYERLAGLEEGWEGAYNAVTIDFESLKLVKIFHNPDAI